MSTHPGAPCSLHTRRYPLASVLVIATFTAPAVLAQDAKPAQAGAATATIEAHHIVGLENIKRNKKGKLTIQNGEMQFTAGKVETKVPVSSIDGIFTGEETTQAGGKAASLGKIAVPYEGGRVLSLLLKTKIDILTVSYRDANGGFHGIILSLPKGQAAQVRSQLLAGGAHASASAATQPAQENKL